MPLCEIIVPYLLFITNCYFPGSEGERIRELDFFPSLMQFTGFDIYYFRRTLTEPCLCAPDWRVRFAINSFAFLMIESYLRIREIRERGLILVTMEHSLGSVSSRIPVLSHLIGVKIPLHQIGNNLRRITFLSTMDMIKVSNSYLLRVLSPSVRLRSWCSIIFHLWEG